jgi:large subunit ribosomal protein L19e
MKLERKKALIARTLGIGKSRISLNQTSLDLVKEAITKQDIKDLLENKAIMIKPIKGKKTIVKRKTRRRSGSVKKKVNTSKEEYMTLTRKLRKYVSNLKYQGKISTESANALRKRIRSRDFRSLSQLKSVVQDFLQEESK